MCFEEYLREYQKVVLTHFLKKIDLRLYRTQPTKCIFIQEPYVIRNKVSGFAISDRIYYRERDVIKSAVLVKNPKIQVIFIETYSTELMTIVKLEFKNKFIYGISLYCSPFQSIETELYHLKETINAIKPENYIICMDSNARSVVR